jgi:GNAT superfamily N-acetyltransferase
LPGVSNLAGISISLRAFDDSIREAYKTLFPGDPDKSEDLLDWRFRRNPHGLAKFAVATKDGQTVGLIALVPTRLRSGSAEVLGYQAIDTAVHPSCRGRGLFVRTGELAQDPDGLGGEVIWGFPNANAAPGWYGRLGWTNFGQVPLLMRPLRGSFLLGRLHPRLSALNLPLIRRRTSSAEIYTDAVRLSADFDKLWRRVAPQLGTAVDRSGDWLRWRLVDKPGSNYRCVGKKSPAGDLEAFVATKLADKHGGRLCYVMEVTSTLDHQRDLTRILLGELSVAARSGAEVALAWCAKSTPTYRAYRKAGFLPVPPGMRPIEINFGARALREESAAIAVPGAPWYISFLDSDTN